MLSVYHDGELAPALAERVRAHMDECRECRLEYQRLGEMTNAVRHLPRREAPTSLARMIRRRIDEEVRGMVPILRDELLTCRARPVLVPAVSLGALLTLTLLGLLLLLDAYVPSSPRFDSVWGRGTLAPAFLQVDMTSPRFRDGSVNMLPFTEVERGGEGTLLTLASIDQNGFVYDLEVLYRSGDEQILRRTLEVLRTASFEPARIGEQNVAVNFLYLFTTTEVRLSTKRIT